MFTYIKSDSFIFGGSNFNPSMFAIMTVKQDEDVVTLKATLANGDSIVLVDHFDSIEEAKMVTEAVQLACTNSGGMERRIYGTIIEEKVIPVNVDGFTYCLNTANTWRNSQLNTIKPDKKTIPKRKWGNQANWS